ncbi:hypothetical protein HDU85_000819 [Gaertneriomyces sp. JEL0708]|nr:hypothetical protein HDU85_000819 [Gaertneriomyces sp. JEL0708]
MTEREHCAQHKSPEVNILEQPWVSCGLLGIVDPNDHCETCDPDMFKRMRLARQNVVKDFLEANNVDAVVDRIIDAGDCGRERPDFWVDCGTHILVMGVDEHQHSGRACECELTNITASNGVATTFLRFNPDKYRTLPGDKVLPISRRPEILLEWTTHHIQNPPAALLSVMHLFFNEYRYGDEKLTSITR